MEYLLCCRDTVITSFRYLINQPTSPARGGGEGERVSTHHGGTAGSCHTALPCATSLRYGLV